MYTKLVKSSFWHYQTVNRISESTSDVLAAHLVAAAFLATRHRSAKLGYVTMPISSGSRLYRLIDELGVSAEELKSQYRARYLKEVIGTNLEVGKYHADRIADSVEFPLIVPACFEQVDIHWTHTHYMEMWGKVMVNDPRLDSHYLLTDWQYSSGSCEEVLLSLQMALGFRQRANITIFDEKMNILPLQDILRLIIGALKYISRNAASPIAAPIIVQVLSDLFDMVQILAFDRKSVRKVESEYFNACDLDASMALVEQHFGWLYDNFPVKSQYLEFYY